MKAFAQAVGFLPENIRAVLMCLPEQTAQRISEVRLRANQPVVLVTGASSSFITISGRFTRIYSDNVMRASPEDIACALGAFCGYSVHSCQQSINRGFITLAGGHRAGLCGTAVSSRDGILSLKDISCLNLRIARQFIGCSKPVFEALGARVLCGVLLCGSPSSGKTTLLRDLVRALSSGEAGEYYKVCVVDERSEIAACSAGVAQMQLGPNTDVLNAYPKSEGILSALRSMSPQLIVCDEVGSMDDVQAIMSGLDSGVSFIAAAHAGSEEELRSRTQIRRLMDTRAFSSIIMLESAACPTRIKRIYTYEEWSGKT
ncbi:MAG: stage III sporulation protein AA [Clostridiales bacterium]|nr:stage III sporulation protein AA [Clostridiales bacterium]